MHSRDGGWVRAHLRVPTPWRRARQPTYHTTPTPASSTFPTPFCQTSNYDRHSRGHSLKPLLALLCEDKRLGCKLGPEGLPPRKLACLPNRGSHREGGQLGVGSKRPSPVQCQGLFYLSDREPMVSVQATVISALAGSRLQPPRSSRVSATLHRQPAVFNRVPATSARRNLVCR